MKPYPTWVCYDCAIVAFDPISTGHKLGISTYHEGDKCGVCGEKKATTQPRDFGYPEFNGHTTNRRRSKHEI